MAAEGNRRAPSSPKRRSIALLLFFLFLAAAGTVGAKTSSTSTSRRVAYSEPTTAEGGQVVRYNFTLGVATRAPDCYREYYFSFFSFLAPAREVGEAEACPGLFFLLLTSSSSPPAPGK